MERLQCKACGSYGMVPVELEPDEAEGAEDVLGQAEGDQESRFFTCHVCGDNWLSVRHVERGDCRITFVHQMGLQPTLKRVAHMDTPIVLNEKTVGAWTYFFGDDEIEEAEWRRRLEGRRRVLRSICSN